MQSVIDTVEALEAQVGKRSDAVNLKVIDHLDGHAQRWLAASPLAFAGFTDARQIDATIAGGAAGFASAPEPGQLRLPRAALDDPQQARAGRAARPVFLVLGGGPHRRLHAVGVYAGGEILIRGT